MGILGLTHDENGSALEKLPVTIKVAIGEGPEPGNQNDHPRRLDHFVFKRKTLRGQDVVWDPAPDIAQVHGEKPIELGIIFLSDDPTEVFRTQYALWTQAGCKCHGELVQISNGEGQRFEMQATRRTQKHPEGEPWPGDYEDEVIARICELTHQPGYNQARTKMLSGQWARDLVSLERSLLNEIETLPDKSVRVTEDADQRRSCGQTKSPAGEIGAPNSTAAAFPREEPASFTLALFQ